MWKSVGIKCDLQYDVILTTKSSWVEFTQLCDDLCGDAHLAHQHTVCVLQRQHHSESLSQTLAAKTTRERKIPNYKLQVF